MNVVPFKKRRFFDIVIAIVVTLLFLAAAGVVWYAIAVGVRDPLVILAVIALTGGFSCALTALITGKMEWLLIGLWELPI